MGAHQSRRSSLTAVLGDGPWAASRSVPSEVAFRVSSQTPPPQRPPQMPSQVFTQAPRRHGPRYLHVGVEGRNPCLCDLLFHTYVHFG